MEDEELKSIKSNKSNKEKELDEVSYKENDKNDLIDKSNANNSNNDNSVLIKNKAAIDKQSKSGCCNPRKLQFINEIIVSLIVVACCIIEIVLLIIMLISYDKGYNSFYYNTIIQKFENVNVYLDLKYGYSPNNCNSPDLQIFSTTFVPYTFRKFDKINNVCIGQKTSTSELYPMYFNYELGFETFNAIKSKIYDEPCIYDSIQLKNPITFTKWKEILICTQYFSNKQAKIYIVKQNKTSNDLTLNNLTNNFDNINMNSTTNTTSINDIKNSDNSTNSNNTIISNIVIDPCEYLRKKKDIDYSDQFYFFGLVNCGNINEYNICVMFYGRIRITPEIRNIKIDDFIKQCPIFSALLYNETITNSTDIEIMERKEKEFLIENNLKENEVSFISFDTNIKKQIVFIRKLSDKFKGVFFKLKIGFHENFVNYTSNNTILSNETLKSNFFNVEKEHVISNKKRDVNENDYKFLDIDNMQTLVLTEILGNLNDKSKTIIPIEIKDMPKSNLILYRTSNSLPNNPCLELFSKQPKVDYITQNSKFVINYIKRFCLHLLIWSLVELFVHLMFRYYLRLYKIIEELNYKLDSMQLEEFYTKLSILFLSLLILIFKFTVVLIQSSRIQESKEFAMFHLDNKCYSYEPTTERAIAIYVDFLIELYDFNKKLFFAELISISLQIFSQIYDYILHKCNIESNKEIKMD